MKRVANNNINIETSENKNMFVAIIISLAVGFAGGWYVSSSPLVGIGSSAEVQRLQDKIERAKQFFPSVSDIRSVSGTIKSIEGNTVRMETIGIINPFEDLPTLREVMISDTTKIVKIESKDPAESQKEFEAYQKALKKSSQRGAKPEIAPPLFIPFREIAITFKDLKTGQEVVAEAADNIKTKTRFEATRIILQTSVTPLAVSAGVASP